MVMAVSEVSSSGSDWQHSIWTAARITASSTHGLAPPQASPSQSRSHLASGLALKTITSMIRHDWVKCNDDVRQSSGLCSSCRHKDPQLDAAGALADLLVFSLNLTGLDILQKIENQDNRWSYRLLYKDLWHADKKQDRNALAKPLLSILQEVEGGPLVKSKVLHLFRDSGVILLASGAGAFIKPPGKSRAPDGTAIGASPTPICSGAGKASRMRSAYDSMAAASELQAASHQERRQ
ncbi:TPA: hypothetical protein ACH3X1_009628 [Trebouxia sp. C0004]